MPAHVERIERHVLELRDAMRSIPEAQAIEAILPVIRRQGWTTHAEAILVQALLASATGLAQMLGHAAQSTIDACGIVGTEA